MLAILPSRQHSLLLPRLSRSVVWTPTKTTLATAACFETRRHPHCAFNSAALVLELRLVDLESPHSLIAQVGEPYRPVAYADRIASRAYPLLHHRVLGGVDLSDGNLKHGRPNVAGAEGDFPSAARNARF